MTRLDSNEKIIFNEKIKQISPKEIATKRQVAKNELEKTKLSKELSELEKEKAVKLEKQFLDEGYNKRISALKAIDKVNEEN